MSVAQQLNLGSDSKLRMRPVDAVASLRGGHVRLESTLLRANQELILRKVAGNSLELDLEIDPQTARWVQLNVLRSPNAEEQTAITFYNFDRTISNWYHTPGEICLDATRSSALPDVWIRPPERAVFERGTDPLALRVLIDRSVVEVFVNQKLYMAMRVYPGREDSVGVSLRAQGQDALLRRLDAWQMDTIYSHAP